jgi:hypothetical protein
LIALPGKVLYHGNELSSTESNINMDDAIVSALEVLEELRTERD